MVVRTRKAVVMAAPEVNPGVEATIDPATDALQTMEPPTITHTNSPIETEGSSGTLTREPAVAGESEVAISIKPYVRGSGTHDVAPRWARYMMACGFRDEAELRIIKLTIPKIPANQRYWIGENIQVDSTGIDVVPFVCVGFLRGASEDYVYVWSQQSFTAIPQFDESTDFAPIVGTASGVVSGAFTGWGFHGILYRPNDVNELAVTLSVAVDGVPSVGDTLIWQDEFYANHGAATVLNSITVGAVTAILVAPMYGEITAGQRVFNQKTGLRLVDDTPVEATVTGLSILRGAGLTMRYNMDGYDVVSTGNRGEMSFSAEAGKPASFQFDFQGTYQRAADIPRPTTINFGVLPSPPRAVNGSAWIGGIKMIVPSISLALGNTVSQDPDCNGDDGVAPAEVDDRNPSWNVSARLARHGGYEWDTKMREQALVSVAAELGTAEGNYVTIVTNSGQVRAAPISDSNGKAQVSATINAVRSTLGFAGDDEVLICHM